MIYDWRFTKWNEIIFLIPTVRNFTKRNLMKSICILMILFKWRFSFEFFFSAWSSSWFQCQSRKTKSPNNFNIKFSSKSIFQIKKLNEYLSPYCFLLQNWTKQNEKIKKLLVQRIWYLNACEFLKKTIKNGNFSFNRQYKKPVTIYLSWNDKMTELVRTQKCLLIDHKKCKSSKW